MRKVCDYRPSKMRNPQETLSRQTCNPVWKVFGNDIGHDTPCCVGLSHWYTTRFFVLQLPTWTVTLKFAYANQEVVYVPIQPRVSNRFTHEVVSVSVRWALSTTILEGENEHRSQTPPTCLLDRWYSCELPITMFTFPVPNPFCYIPRQKWFSDWTNIDVLKI